MSNSTVFDKKPESDPWQNATQAMTCRRQPRQVGRVWIEVFCLKYQMLIFYSFFATKLYGASWGYFLGALVSQGKISDSLLG